MDRVGTDIDARDGAVGEYENGSDLVDVLIYNALLVGLILPNTAGVGQSRCVEDANSGGCYSCSPHSQYLHLLLCRSCP